MSVWSAVGCGGRGAGNKPIRETNPTIERDLGKLLEDSTRGDPDSPLRWTSKSTAKLAAGLVAFGHHVSEVTVQRVLKSMGFSLQANRKTREGEQHPDRDAQFRYINETAKAALAAGQPVISVDSKKRELVGNFKAVGREVGAHRRAGRGLNARLQRQGAGARDPARRVRPARQRGVGHGRHRPGHKPIRRELDPCLVAAPRQTALPGRRQTLTITADCGGSNSNRTRLWKAELQKLADDTGPCDHRLPLPPGNKQVERDRAPAV